MSFLFEQPLFTLNTLTFSFEDLLVTENEVPSSSQDTQRGEENMILAGSRFIRSYDIPTDSQKEFMDQQQVEAIKFTKNNIAVYDKLSSTYGGKINLYFLEDFYTLETEPLKIYHYPKGGSLEQLQTQLDSSSKIEMEKITIQAPKRHILLNALSYKLNRGLIKRFKVDDKQKNKKKGSSPKGVDTAVSGIESSAVSGIATE